MGEIVLFMIQYELMKLMKLMKLIVKENKKSSGAVEKQSRYNVNCLDQFKIPGNSDNMHAYKKDH